MQFNRFTELLLEKNLISVSQFNEIRSAKERQVFSLRNEILFLLILGVLFFTGGAGILIYQNINSAGHFILLFTLLALTASCFIYAGKSAVRFSKQRTVSGKPGHDYAVLAGNLLAGIFIAYAQDQYALFGAYNDLATLFACLLYFLCAYYFDHQGVLSMAIAALCAFVGFSVSPGGILRNQFHSGEALGYYAMATGAALLAWRHYSINADLKKHFGTTYANFALHIIGIAGLANLFEPRWIAALLCLSLALFYFHRLSQKTGSVQMFGFTMIYFFAALSVMAGKLSDALDLHRTTIYLSPLYFAVLIALFVRNLRTFKMRIHD